MISFSVNSKLILTLLVGWLGLTSVMAQTRTIAYTLEFEPHDTRPRMRIELRFAGHESGRTELVLPSRSANETQIYQAIQGLEITPATVQVAETSEPWARVLTHEPGQPIRVRYEMIQERADALQALRGAGFRPIIQPTYFH